MCCIGGDYIFLIEDSAKYCSSGGELLIGLGVWYSSHMKFCYVRIKGKESLQKNPY
jgi:hypothetical protein